MRIYELAKLSNCSSNDIKKILDELNIQYKTHSSSIPDDELPKVKERLALDTGGTEKKDEQKTQKTGISSDEPGKSKNLPPLSVKEEKNEKAATASSKKTKSTENISIELYDESTDSEDDSDFDSVYYENRFNKKKSFKTKSHLKEVEGAKKKEVIPEKVKEKEKEKPAQVSQEGPVKVHDGVTVKELSETMNVPASEIIKKLFLLGLMVSINHQLDKDTILIIADEFKVDIHIDEEKPQEEEEVIPEVPEEESLEVRPPVVTVMGHVNHGKTTLLDTIRKTKVASSESGGITQHIGAYMVEHNNSQICFIDTPGHAAFTNMRAMGANVTDIALLVVAANDGIQPQTLESISHAKEAEVPIIIAINKTDLDDVNIDKIKGELAQNGLTPEDWGGDNLCINISALTGIGIDELLDAINLQAELLELKANPKGKPFGIVLESCQTDLMGPQVTVLVKNGVFKVGDPIVCGHVYGKIRRMESDKGESIDVAYPSTPVVVFGFAEVPEISARVKVYTTEKEAKESAEQEAQARRHKILKKKENVTMENLYSSIQAESKKEFKIILKTDVVGSITAIKSLLGEIASEKIKLKVIHSATGAVTDTDVMFASAYNATIIAYRVKTTPTASTLAKQNSILIKEYKVIYHVYDDVKKGMEGLLDTEYIKNSIGQCEVKKLFKVSKGVVAGCLVIQGKVTRDAYCRVVRQGSPDENEYQISSLRHYKDEVPEVRMGTECGISLKNFTEFVVGDVLEFHRLEKTNTTL